jgi:hypothetical protein
MNTAKQNNANGLISAHHIEPRVHEWSYSALKHELGSDQQLQRRPLFSTDFDATRLKGKAPRLQRVASAVSIPRQ